MKNKIIIITAVIVMSVVGLVSISLIVNDREKSIALNIITSATKEKESEYQYEGKDKKGNYIFKYKKASNTKYIVNIKKDSYEILTTKTRGEIEDK